MNDPTDKPVQMELFEPEPTVTVEPQPPTDPYPYLEPKAILSSSKIVLLLDDLQNRVTQLEERVQTLRSGSIGQSKHIETMHAQVIALTKDFNARFGTVSNCPHCHRKLDSYTLRTKTHCPICGGSLQ